MQPFVFAYSTSRHADKLDFVSVCFCFDTGSHYLVQPGLKLVAILRLQPLEGLYYWCVPLCHTYRSDFLNVVIFIKFPLFSFVCYVYTYENIPQFEMKKNVLFIFMASFFAFKYLLYVGHISLL